jgi:hypothetical protein
LFLWYDWVYVLAEKEVEASLKRELREGFLEVVEGRFFNTSRRRL